MVVSREWGLVVWNYEGLCRDHYTDGFNYFLGNSKTEAVYRGHGKRGVLVFDFCWLGVPVIRIINWI